MYKDKKISVIIAAAGFGKRMGGSTNKQYIVLGDRPVLAHTLGVFQRQLSIDEIIIVVRDDERDMCQKQIVEKYKFSKVKQIVSGGAERQDSVNSALNAIDNQNGYVLIHDGARPFVSPEEIQDVLEMAMTHGAAAVGVAVKDTIKVADEKGCIMGTPERKTLYAIQTPQAFRVVDIKAAFAKAYADGFYGTDDTVLLERLGQKVYISKGKYTNIKITTPEDLVMGEAIIGDQESMKEIRSGLGYDVHAFADNRKLILGGVDIPHTKGLLGHSDADVITHAIMDALLGAAGLRDIGKHFPDTDPQYKSISSLLLLEKVGQLLAERGCRIVNIDSIIIAQAPKLAPHIDQMVSNVAESLGIEPERVNIKATTTERLGFEGREEGISAQAIVTIAR